MTASGSSIAPVCAGPGLDARAGGRVIMPPCPAKDAIGAGSGVSGLHRLLSVIARLAPFQFHGGAQARCLVLEERLARQGEVLRAVNQERAKVLPQFAPRGEHPAIGQVPDHERAHATPGSFSLTVPTVEPGDLPPTDRAARLTVRGILQGRIRAIVSISRLQSVQGSHC